MGFFDLFKQSNINHENQKIINASIDYLIQKGHKKIGMLLPFDYGYANSRYKAWKERMKMESNFF